MPYNPILEIGDFITNPTEQLGQMVCVDIEAAPKYVNGERVEGTDGFRCAVQLRQMMNKHLSVKVPGTKAPFELPKGRAVEVQCQDFEIYIYNNEIKGRASSIVPVQQPK